MIRGQQPIDASRIVDLETMAGKRGAPGDRAVRLREIDGLFDQAAAARDRMIKKTAEQALPADTALPTAGAWVDGPQITLAKGIWLVTATAMIESGAAGAVAIRVHNGTAGQLAAQVSHPATAGNFVTITACGVITLTSGATLTLQAAPSITSATITMKAQTTIGGALPATRLSAVRIGA